jgi:pimeloyl-ACP methyl ester carboxylesterase
MSSLIIFSHANGFAASTYRKLFNLLKPDFHIEAVDKYGHHPDYPVTNNWPLLIEELLTLLRRKTKTEKALLVGHSLGGFLSLMAAYKMPERVRGVILLDSPVVAGWRSHALRMSKVLDIDERFSPARFAKVRRTQWASIDEAYKHFENKALFKRWDKEMLRDYVTHGTVPTDDGQRALAFDREVEYWIFRHFPDHLPSYIRKPCPVPVAFIGGKQSEEVRMVGTHYTERVTQGRVYWIDGTHLFPMECPVQTAALIREISQDLAS